MKKIANVTCRQDEWNGNTVVRFIFENGWQLSCCLTKWVTEIGVFDPDDSWKSRTVFTEVFGRNYDYTDDFNDSECVVENVTSEQLESIANYIADIKGN